MGRRFRAWLDGSRVYGCSACGTHVADADDIVSKVCGGRGVFLGGRGAMRRLGRARTPRPAAVPPAACPAAGGGGHRVSSSGGAKSSGWRRGEERVERKKGADTRASGAKRRRSAFRFLSPTHTTHTQAFQGRHGRAYLFYTVVNVTHGPKEERLLITGLHTVRSAMCVQCAAVLGWTYVHAYEPSQQYKQGKTILEKALITAEDAGGGLSS